MVSLGLVSSAPTALVVWALLDLPFSTAEAWFGTLLTAPAIAVSFGFLLVVSRRRRIRTGKEKVDPGARLSALSTR